jgi:PAS domain S-box-containing protein
MVPVTLPPTLADGELLKSLLEDNPTAIDFKDREGRYLLVSLECARQLGLRRPDDAVGKTAADFLSEEGATLARQDEHSVLATGRAIVELERREVHADGRVTWTSVSRQPLRDAAGEIVGTVGSARDITRRKLADESLLKVNGRLARVIATQRELAACALDQHAVTQLVVERALELTDADAAAVRLLDGDEVVTRAACGEAAGPAGARRPAAASVAGIALTTGRPLLIRDAATDPRVTADNAPRGALVCAPFFHADAPAGTVEVFAAAANHFDSHARNAVALLAAMLSTALSQAAEFTAKRAQVETLAHFEATFQGAPMGIAMVTPDEAIVTGNPALHALLGHSEDELTALRLGADLLKDDDGLIAGFLGGEDDRYRGEHRLRRRDGSLVWSDLSLAMVRDDEGGPVFAVAMVQDLTARKRAEDERDRMEAELRLAQKLEAVGQLSAGIAHEINTPIQFVSDSVRFLQDAFEDLMLLSDAQDRLRAAAEGVVDATLVAGVRDAEERADLDYLRERVPAAVQRGLDGLSRVSTIVAAMRAFAEPASSTAAPVDLNEAVRHTLVVAAHECGAVADVRTELGKIPPVVCDASEINHVLLNLVTNAAHAIAEAVGDDGERGCIEASTRAEGDEIVVRIADGGCGMPAHVAERAFDPFFTTKDVGSGTGQGLTVSRSVARRHGGELVFTTVPGKGSVFELRLPTVRDDR